MTQPRGGDSLAPAGGGCRPQPPPLCAWRSSRFQRPAPFSRGVHPEAFGAQGRQPLRPRCSLQHGHGGKGAGQQGAFRHDAHAGQPLHRPAGLWIQDVAVAPALPQQATLTISAGRQPAGCQRHGCQGQSRCPRIAEPDRPGRAIGVRADGVEIAPKVDQPMLHPSCGADCRRPVRGIDAGQHTVGPVPGIALLNPQYFRLRRSCGPRVAPGEMQDAVRSHRRKRKAGGREHRSRAISDHVSRVLPYPFSGSDRQRLRASAALTPADPEWSRPDCPGHPAGWNPHW